jgi:glutamyl-tRNA reductase
MNLRVIGCNFRTAAVDLREKLAFDPTQQPEAILALAARFGCEVVVLSTCNRVELYVARQPSEQPLDAGLAVEFLSEIHQVPAETIRPLLYELANEQAVQHLSRVAASLDSLIVGEGQIAGQVKQAFEFAQSLGATGPLLNVLFPHALRVAKRVRTETGIAHGHVSVSSVAVDYVRQVFDHFSDKTVLVIGAGKMARLTLKHLVSLKPKRILVTNRSPEKAHEVAGQCGGTAVPWDQLDDALAQADIALSTTGASEPIMPRPRFDTRVRPKRSGKTLVVLDIAVPRDFDPAIHDGDTVCVFNIDDLTRVREQTLAGRRKHIAPAEAIIDAEVKKFGDDWNRRKSGPVIQQLRSEVDKVRAEVVAPLLGKLNGKLTDADKAFIEGAFRLFQNKLLHGPIAAMQDASKTGESNKLLDAVKKLFGLP